MDYSAFIEGINTKSEKAWGKLYDHYYASLCSYVEKFLGDAGIAEDIVQECLIKMWNTSVTFPDVKSLSAWLYKSVYHASVSVLREKKLLERFQENWNEMQVSDEETAQDMALCEEVISYFYELLYQLPVQQRDILLYSLQGLKVQDIAGIMDISENSIKTQKKRAYLFVREHFDKTKLRVLLTIFFKKRRNIADYLGK